MLGMSKPTTPSESHPDSALIVRLGGAAAVADMLGYDKAKGGVQRVHNWMTRGIPPRVKVERPDLFLGVRSGAGAREQVGAEGAPAVSEAKAAVQAGA
jgi:hypothetical protein